MAETDSSGNYLAYLNATPQQGDDRLRTWPEYRVAHLREASASSVHVDARALNLAFAAAQGSCVIDDYVTRVEARHYREIACFIQGRTTASVIVAAAPANQWRRVGAELERAVSDYRVG